jgi:3,4-dihydroxy 2-butanone 4-phosphate synthase/GTP cyclohydrolase II
MNPFASIEAAIADLRQGRMLILVDDEHREHEGDLMIAAEKVTSDAINFIATHARGLMCLSLTDDFIERLRIPLMPVRNKLPNQATFTVSIEAATGVTTGVSTHDRVRTIQVAIDPASTPEDVSMPGHVFPLQARKGGVLERPGHTEASVDLAKLAGLSSAAVICEIMNEDGTMARVSDLREFAKKHDIKIVAINDLIDYRFKHEMIIEEIASASLPLKQSEDFIIKVFRDRFTGAEHLAIIHGALNSSEPTWVRIHSECLTGDSLGSKRCDCGWQLDQSLTEISKQGGILLYMRQEGRGIGLSNKIKAYHLQSQGLDTVQANQELGFLADHRHYGLCAQMLRYLGIHQIRLLTNNPRKINDLERLGIEIIERVPLEMQPAAENIDYLTTKRDKLGHFLNLNVANKNNKE